MTLPEILPSIKQLTAFDKLKLIRILAEELDTNENIFPFQTNKIYYCQHLTTHLVLPKC